MFPSPLIDHSDFVGGHHDGDPRGLICKAAGNSPQSAGLAKLAELETPYLQVRNLAMAARMMGSADDMPKEPGAALDALADTIVTMLDELCEERDRLWRLTRETLKAAPLAGSVASP
jgi:hypothetical protein